VRIPRLWYGLILLILLAEAKKQPQLTSGRLQVAGQAAGAVQRMRRSLEDLRRETGIDREVQNARRAFEDAVPRDVRGLDVRRAARKGVDAALSAAEVQPQEQPAIPPAKREVPAREPEPGQEEPAAAEPGGAGSAPTPEEPGTPDGGPARGGAG